MTALEQCIKLLDRMSGTDGKLALDRDQSLFLRLALRTHLEVFLELWRSGALSEEQFGSVKYASLDLLGVLGDEKEVSA